MKPVALFVSGVACAGLACAAAQADVKLPAIFGSNMVFQQQTEAPIWGWAAPGEEVTISASWADAPVSVRADQTGKWKTKLKTPVAGVGPYVVTIKAGNTITLDNVAVGEVWVCSGQSNMEMPVGDFGGGYRGVVDWEEEVKAADNPGIRLFTVKNAISPTPKDDCEGVWTTCMPPTAKSFSATGYFFGRELHKTLNIPIGLISSDWGGTVCESWTSEEGLKGFPEFTPDLDFMHSANATNADAPAAWRRAMEPWWDAVEKKDPGSVGLWLSPMLDDNGWTSFQVPGQWGGDLSTFDGIVWMRKHITIPAAWAGKDLKLDLGAIDDMDTTYFDGTRVGATETPGFHDQARHYTIPGKLVLAGEHVISVRMLDTGGPGGLMGADEQNTLRPAGMPGETPISLAGPWKFRQGVKLSELPPIETPKVLNPNMATALNNGMIAPIQPLAIRGAVWYQGESNRGRAAQYAKLFPAMITDWRTKWGRGDFPFYFVQLAPYRYGGDKGETALLREAQLKTLKYPNTGMAVTMDIGNAGDIHPANKQDVGKRLALWALAKTYGKGESLFTGPLYSSMKVEGGKATIRFDYGAGLAGAKQESLQGFMIAGEDKKFVPATAIIENDTVIVSSDQVASPKAVRYGWADVIPCNLVNAAGLPASPFRTDDWPN